MSLLQTYIHSTYYRGKKHNINIEVYGAIEWPNSRSGRPCHSFLPTLSSLQAHFLSLPWKVMGTWRDHYPFYRPIIDTLRLARPKSCRTQLGEEADGDTHEGRRCYERALWGVGLKQMVYLWRKQQRLQK